MGGGVTTTGGATTQARCRTLGMAFGSPLVVGRWLAVQTRRRADPFVLAVTLALGPNFTEPVGGEQQPPDAGEKASQDPYRDVGNSRNISIRNISNIHDIGSIHGIRDIRSFPKFGRIPHPRHHYPPLP